MSSSKRIYSWLQMSYNLKNRCNEFCGQRQRQKDRQVDRHDKMDQKQTEMELDSLTKYAVWNDRKREAQAVMIQTRAWWRI